MARIAIAGETAGLLVVVLGNGVLVLVLVGALIILFFVPVQLWIGVQVRHEIRRRRKRLAQGHARPVAPPTSREFALLGDRVGPPSCSIPSLIACSATRSARQRVISGVPACRSSDTPRGLLAGGLAIITILVLTWSGEPYPHNVASTAVAASHEHRLPRPSELTVYVVPKAPGPMAIGPNGNLFIADDSRDQILERVGNGRFVVVAGDGKRGSSGDGGPAVEAELDDPGGMAFGPAGALYFTDIGNNEVRRFVPGGNIRTVAGAPGRWTRPVVNGEAALHAHLLSPVDVTFGRSGQLYLADEGDNEVLRVGPGDKLYVVAGDPHIRAAGIADMGMPAAKASPDGPRRRRSAHTRHLVFHRGGLELRCEAVPARRRVGHLGTKARRDDRCARTTGAGEGDRRCRSPGEGTAACGRRNVAFGLEQRRVAGCGFTRPISPSGDQ